MVKHFNQIAPVLLNPFILKSEIRMEVVFGTPSQNCIGSGICMVMGRLPSIEILKCPHAPAWISYDQGLLRFRFSKSAVVREDAVRRLESPWFLVQEPFQLSGYTARRLGMISNWFSTGLFPVTETEKDWIISFPIVAKN